MALEDFIPSKTLKALFRHTIAVICAIFCFALTGTIAGWVFNDELIKSIIHWIEYIGIILILIFLLVELLKEIIKGKGNGKITGE